MEIFEASNQWAKRPVDERFWTLDDMYSQCRTHFDNAAESTVALGDLRVEAKGSDLSLVGKTGTSAEIGHYAFGQLCTRAKAPAGYLRGLPPTLAAQNVNHGLKALGNSGDKKARLLFHRNGKMVLRAALSEKYERVWNYEILDRLCNVLPSGWKAPPARPAVRDPRARPATRDDISTRKAGILSVKEGDMIAPSGLYASDKDMFVFLVNEETVIDDGTDEGLARGFMLWNSEVGDKSLGGMSFLYKAVCGNHIVWDAQGVKEFRVRHVGQAKARAWRNLSVQMKEYADGEGAKTAAKIKLAREYEIGARKVDVIESLLGFAKKKRLVGINEASASAAFDLAKQHRDWYQTPPSTVWGMVNGLTELSQASKHTDTRVALDNAAGKIMEMAF